MKLRYLVLYPLLGGMLLFSCQKDKGTPAPPVGPPSQEEPPIDSSDNGEEELPPYTVKIQNAHWDTTHVSDAIMWLYYHFTDLFSAKESITVFDINLNNKEVTIKFPYVTSGRLKTSVGAANVNASVAINGSYFDTKKGGPTTFFKLHNQIITYTKPRFTTFRENVGFAVEKDGSVSIILRPTSGWETTTTYDLLVSGPPLVYNGEVMAQVNSTFNTGRNPRTAIGLTEDNHLIALVVDGRDSQSAGMTNKELGKTMKSLGCEVAMNLDGGGSSTAWVKGEGVVNYPSDNNKFDHGGERGVATVIAFVMGK